MKNSRVVFYSFNIIYYYVVFTTAVIVIHIKPQTIDWLQLNYTLGIRFYTLEIKFEEKKEKGSDKKKYIFICYIRLYSLDTFKKFKMFCSSGPITSYRLSGVLTFALVFAKLR